MSFECDRCHLIATGRNGSDVHFGGSYGPCETCHRSANCADCRCDGDWSKARAAAKEIAR